VVRRATREVGVGLLFVAMFWVASIQLAYATDWYDECEHPRFQEVGCTYPGEQGPPGQDGRDGRDGHDGRDGVDGQDGRDGIDGQDGDSAYQVAVNNGFEGSETEWLASLQGRDGKDGRDGIDGIDGKDGVVPNEWILETRYKFDRVRDAAAAEAAMDAYLPQYSNQRLHFNAAHVQGRTGIGFGYAYMLDNERNAGLTFAVGHAGSETAVRASFGFEFGDDRPMNLNMSHLKTEKEIVVYEPPSGQVLVPEDEYESLMVQAVQKEELEEYAQQQEDRYAQQQSLLDSLKNEHKDDEAELERLKIKAAELAAEQQKKKESDAARRAAALEALTKKSEAKDDG